jgi:hypothetical protein
VLNEGCSECATPGGFEVEWIRPLEHRRFNAAAAGASGVVSYRLVHGMKSHVVFFQTSPFQTCTSPYITLAWLVS